MNDNFRETWELYASSWKAEGAAQKQAIFAKCLDSTCRYNDPIAKTEGWDELAAYMVDFQKQIPGGHFVTTYFLAHSNKSIAKWEMRNGDDMVLGDGISYGEYNDEGALTSMTGFFEAPQP